MAHKVFDGDDPRKTIRTKIGTNHMVDGEVKRCMAVSTSGGTVYVPMFLGEEVAVKCPALPYIKLDLLSIPAKPHNIRASVRRYDALISIDVTFHDMDNIDITSFGKKVADAFVNLVRINQESTSGIYFYNVWNEGRIIYEDTCDGVILHYIMELTAENSDVC